MIRHRHRKMTQKPSLSKPNRRSRFEDKIEGQLQSAAVSYRYEHLRIPYHVERFYKPDFVLDNGIMLEVKGFFTGADRSKHLLIQAQHPELDIRFIFQNANNRLSKQSKTTYAGWCEKHGFKWAEGIVPEVWLK